MDPAPLRVTPGVETASFMAIEVDHGGGALRWLRCAVHVESALQKHAHLVSSCVLSEDTEGECARGEKREDGPAHEEGETRARRLHAPLSRIPT